MKYSRKTAWKLLATVLLICTVMMAASPQGYALWTGTHKDAIKGVVSVVSTTEDDFPLETTGIGSGFGVGKAGKETDIFVTNRHCVMDDEDHICNYVYIMLEDGALTYIVEKDDAKVEAKQDQLIRCEVLYPKAGDPEFPDVAILRAERVVPGRVALPLKSGFEMSAGDKVYTMGFPGTADDATKWEETSTSARQTISAATESVTVAEGVISRTVNPAEYEQTTVFQHTAQMSHGNSGGPLVDEKGYVVGINTYGHQTLDGGAKVDTYFLSIYVDYAMQKLDALGISYDKYNGGFFAEYLPWIAGAATLLAAGAIVFFAVKAGKKKPKFRLQGVTGPFANRRFAIDSSLRLGRDPAKNDLIFPAQADMVGRAHCRLDVKDNQLFLTDLDSRNGTYLNGRRLMPRQTIPVVPGDTISLADDGCRFLVDVAHHK